MCMYVCVPHTTLGEKETGGETRGDRKEGGKRKGKKEWSFMCIAKFFSISSTPYILICSYGDVELFPAF